MAKLGNESNLILKLLIERMATAKDTLYQRTTINENYKSGYARCFEEMRNEINRLKRELEEGRL